MTRTDSPLGGDQVAVRPPLRAPAERRSRGPVIAGALAVLAIASVLFSRFDLHAWMIRDSSIYIYGGQQLNHGLLPYVSEMDPKGPMSSIIAGLGVAVADVTGTNDIVVVRAEFCALAILGVLGLYLLVLEMFNSVVAGVVAAAVFTSFENFAFNVTTATDGHIPGIVFLIFGLWLTVRKNWYLAGFAAALAFLTWQPLFIYPIMALVCAVVWSPGERLRSAGRSVAGLATPFLALVIAYGVDGHLVRFFQGLLIFPLTGLQRPPQTPARRLQHFVEAIPRLYGYADILFWGGLVLMFLVAIWTVASARSQWYKALLSPIVLLLVVTFVIQTAYVVYDYIGYPHTWPILPYAALGVGAAVALVLERVPSPSVRAGGQGVLLAAVVALVVACGIVYSRPQPRDGELHGQQVAACILNRSVAPGTLLWTIDDPAPLVLLHRRNPDNFPFVGGGLDIFKVDHTRGGFNGWMRQVSHASVVVDDTWVGGKYKAPIMQWLGAHGYSQGYIGPWIVWVDAAAQRHMAAQSIRLASKPHLIPLHTHGRPFRAALCPAVTRND